MQARIIDLPRFIDERGNLSVIENRRDIPFTIRRTYWVYDVPGGEQRGGHAYRQNEELVVALSGSFDVVVDDGRERRTFSMNRSYFGLYLPRGTWRELNNFSTNSMALVLASTDYDTADYIHDYQDFLNYIQHERQ